ncbi:Short-chain dehydrogenase/reductase SDR [Penicillium expansum]|uniref:3beta-hydroxysteroid 3-dehydrogenase n=1 Tax=Penicillium expansum TaxID=27334 RepID=A0A0A2J5T9_PENEN|nr:Short-chain dehydrogenase/reductase SDR [Penicillium expansum]KGO39453.1 Short-chain dehydrogenase/reductase SDR [Penicillium expansum]KGO50058.1 Short-chain dehydrogenase/reductase SDR [Penicillium expansum]KGO55815.1 Short-chain dehydrogenase/reductase SDR [Penicillium expansum]
MVGTVVITGATGSLALEAVQQLLSSHPSLTIVGTVRNATKSPKSAQLLRLEEIAQRYPSSKLLIKSVDLNSTLEVREFSNEIAGLVESNELPPISAIVCNAFTWSLDGQQFSKDRLESTFQVNHLSHFLLVLRLLRSMNPETGRVVMLSSEVHDPEHSNALSKLGAELPSNERLDVLVHPGADEIGAEHDMGWQRYANSKLANVMFMQSLNQRLQQNPQLSKITVTAMDPGGLVNSRAHVAQRSINRIIFGLLALLLPIIKLFTYRLRSNSDSARDVLALALAPEYASVRGHFNGRKPQPPARVSEDEAKCEAMWEACWNWVDMKAGETCVPKSYS